MFVAFVRSMILISCTDFVKLEEYSVEVRSGGKHATSHLRCLAS